MWKGTSQGVIIIRTSRYTIPVLTGPFFFIIIVNPIYRFKIRLEKKSSNLPVLFFFCSSCCPLQKSQSIVLVQKKGKKAEEIMSDD
jgi:hypothetical protein